MTPSHTPPQIWKKGPDPRFAKIRPDPPPQGPGQALELRVRILFISFGNGPGPSKVHYLTIILFIHPCTALCEVQFLKNLSAVLMDVPFALVGQEGLPFAVKHFHALLCILMSFSGIVERHYNEFYQVPISLLVSAIHSRICFRVLVIPCKWALTRLCT